MNDKRNAAAEPDHAGGVPATDEFVESLVPASQAVSFAKRQIIIEGAVENMSPVEEGWAVLISRMEAGGIIAGGVLHGPNRVQRLREGIVHVIEDTMPGTVAKRDYQGVIVRIVFMRTHEEVEDLMVIEYRQACRITVVVKRARNAAQAVDEKE